MLKKVFYFYFIFLFFFPANAHVEHYKNLNKLEFDLFRNNKLIGTHIYLFERDDEQLTVNSKIIFEIKKIGVVLYKYYAEGQEIYKNGKLISFKSTADQNKKKKYCNIKVEGNSYIIDGSSHKGIAPLDYIVGTWWNHSIIKSSAQISAVSGRIIKQKVTFLGNEIIDLNGKKIKTLHFNFSSTDKNLNEGKKLNTDVWYEEDTLKWVKASFEKMGLWEYRLRLDN